jgi:hypothetical protein
MSSPPLLSHLVSVTELAPLCIHDINDHKAPRQASHVQRIRKLRCCISVVIGAARVRREPVGWVVLLPLGPEAVDVDVVQEEHGVFGSGQHANNI